MQISVVLPCYNEATVLREAHRQLSDVSGQIPEVAFEFTLWMTGAAMRHRPTYPIERELPRAARFAWDAVRARSN